MPTCYRHPTRETRVSCSSCGRPICPDCMTSTPVGMRCPECARERTRVHRLPTTPSAPDATRAIIAVNVIVYLAEIASGGGFGSVRGTVLDHGALSGSVIATDHEYWRIVTSGFLHASLFHVAANMIFIWFVGSVLEQMIGPARFLALYATSLLCGSFGVLLLQPNALTVGASGAAFGLLGCLLVEARSRGVDLWSSGLLPIALFNFAFTFLYPGISIGGHLGGFAGGLLVGIAFDQVDRRRLPRVAAFVACAAIALAAVAGGIAVAGGAGLLHHSTTI